MSQHEEDHDAVVAEAYYAGVPLDAAARPEKPTSVRRVVALIWAKLGLTLIGFVVSFSSLDDTLDRTLATQPRGAAELDPDLMRGVVAVSLVVGLVISVAIAAVAAWLIGRGTNWARIVYTIMVSAGLVFTLIGLLAIASRTPTEVLLSLVGAVINVVILMLLWQSESNAFFSAP